MGRIILTIAGPWSKPPRFETAFFVEHGSSDSSFVDDFIALSRESESLEPKELETLRGHQSIIHAALEVEKPGDREGVLAAARLMLAAAESGANGILVETALKALTPSVLKGLDLRDIRVLFHLFVQVWADDQKVSSEGMQAFALPDIEVPYTQSSVAAAQAAAFGLAARMVCDRFRPIDGGVYRNTESAPLYSVRRVEKLVGTLEDEFPVNPHGVWRLLPEERSP